MRGHSHHHEHREAGSRSAESVLPKVIGILVIIGVLRAVIGHKRQHGGRSGWFERRHEAIAAMHRDLHQADSA